MVDNRFNKILTIIIIIVLMGLFVILGFWGYDIFQKYYIKNGAEDAVNELDEKLENIEPQNMINIFNEQIEENIVETNTANENYSNTINKNTNTIKKSNNQTSTAIQMKYKGFDVAGKIEIPKINLKYPILTVATVSSMKVSIGIVYGPGPNKIGNTVLMGHNYRNGALFSNNKKLEVGDEVYITDMTGERIKYTIYNKYITTSTDFDYATRDTEGRREISMESCTDDAKSRLILWAKESL